MNLVLFSLPVLIYFILLRRRGRSSGEILMLLGLRSGLPKYYAWASGILLLTGGLAMLASWSLPAEVLRNPNLTVSQYEGMSLGASTILLVLLREAFYVALGEELLFRGLLGGVLFRRLGFRLGNVVQTLIFILPHLGLLVVSLYLLPLVLVQLLIGWLLGWLRFKSKSIAPGWMAHSLANTLGALIFLY